MTNPKETPDPAQAMMDLIDAFKRSKFTSGLSFAAQVSASAMGLWESLYDELSLHLPDLDEARRVEIAEQLVMRVHRDWGVPDDR